MNRPPLHALPDDWREALAGHVEPEAFGAVLDFVRDERARGEVYPPADEVFAALELCPFAEVRVVILGQDPYHGPGQAHGLAFSVRPGVPLPPSLRNLFKEREDDLGLAVPDHGELTAWARQGMLLLNTVLTVRRGEANAHRGRGWEPFTDAVIDAVAGASRPVVFVLWGAAAQKKARRIDAARHRVVRGPHPSPLSAYRGFFGSRPFSTVNAALDELGHPPVDWRT